MKVKKNIPTPTSRGSRILGRITAGTTLAKILEVKNGDFNVLSNDIASQVEIGKKYGGVFPAMAKR